MHLYNRLKPSNGNYIFFVNKLQDSRVDLSKFFFLSTVPAPTGFFVMKQLKVEGFMVFTWLPRWPEAFKELSQWIKEV